MREPFSIGETRIGPGERAAVDLRVPGLYSHTGMTLPLHVIHATRPGPTLFLSGAVHGDEINGVEIIRRVLRDKALDRLRGTLIAVPVVNIYGFMHQARYLPDRRDLNRSFPGSDRGSMAARMAHVFLTEIVARCSHGIDLHTAAVHRDNLPQVRGFCSDPVIRRMAQAFSAPVILNTKIVEGSLREAASSMGIPVIVYEGGEALRFDARAIRLGVDGVIAVMREIGMLGKTKKKKAAATILEADTSLWVRAPQSGTLLNPKTLGTRVSKGQRLGAIADPFGTRETPVVAPVSGIIVGRTNIPLVNEGEALFHIARFDTKEKIAGQVIEVTANLDPEFKSRDTASENL